MQIINIEEYDDEVVLHFGGERKKINAYTLASSLVSIADAVKAANDVLNPGYDVEVLVEAFGEGSFRAKIKTVFKGAGNIFSKDALKAVALSVLANFIYQHTLAPDSQVVVNVKDRKSTRLNSSHVRISYAVFCLKKKTTKNAIDTF